jgi:Flp pilus assembly protein TadB
LTPIERLRALCPATKKALDRWAAHCDDPATSLVRNGMLQPVRFVRLVGIAIGSIVAAWLVMWLVGGFLPATIAQFAGVLTLVLGGLIYADIRRRDRPAA